jgi:TatD DNase family protein
LRDIPYLRPEMLTDTHSHLYSQAFEEDLEEVMERAVQAGVRRVVLPNVDRDSLGPLTALVRRSNHELSLFGMLGIHPCSVDENWNSLWKDLVSMLEEPAIPGAPRFVGIGEIGLDLYWRQDNLDIQKAVFLEQLGVAREMDLPVCIHSRDSLHEILDCTQTLSFRGVFHCFGGNAEEAARITDRGQYLGIGGTLTFKSNGALRELMRGIDRSRILLETDAPYLAPVPFRGKRNEPAMMAEVAACLADLWEMRPDEVALLCSRNAEELFGLDAGPVYGNTSIGPHS